MKEIFKYLICGVIVLASSCSGLLDEHPKKVDSSTFMSNAEEVQSVVNSVYYELGRTAGFGRYLSVFSESLSDYCYGRGSYATSYSSGLTSAGISLTKDTWAVLYRSIRFCNEILNRIPDSDLTDAERANLTGEVRFLRAFSYSFLVKYYGALPFFNEKNMDNFNKPRTPEKEIWEFISDESDYCAEHLPAEVAEQGHPSKFAAMMLKTEASLYLEDWSIAAETAKKIIDSKEYALVEVSESDDFDRLYGSSANGSSEEIFYIKYNTDHGASFPWMFLCKPNPVFNTGALGIYTDYVNNKVIAGWDKNDCRYQYSLYQQKENGALNSMTPTGMICLKYRDYGTNGSTMANDYPVYRYADVLLYYAEALCRRDGTPGQEAMEKVNMIHRRAYGLDPDSIQANDYDVEDYSTQDLFIELVLKERGYEDIFEGKRYCDLKRCGLLAEYAVRAGRIASVDQVGDAAYWWPIPTDEFNYNEALDPSIDQNPGY